MQSKKYSGTPPYSHLGNTVTSTFLAARLNDHTFSCIYKIRSRVNTAKFFWLIGDRINGVPLKTNFSTPFSETEGKPIIKRNVQNVIINDYSNGELKMIETDSFSKSPKATWINKYLDEKNKSKWKLFFDLELESFGRKTVLPGNLNMKDTKALLKTKDKFINEVLTIWAEVNFEVQIKSDNHFLNQSCTYGTTR